MCLIEKNQDLQGTRYYFAGAFRLIEKDWIIEAKKRKNNKRILKQNTENYLITKKVKK